MGLESKLHGVNCPGKCRRQQKRHVTQNKLLTPMKKPRYEFSNELEKLLVSNLGSKSKIDSLLGQGKVLSGDMLKSPESSKNSYLSRLEDLISTLESHIEIVAKNSEEIDCSPYKEQAQGEIIATLICIREIWSTFPELWGNEN